VIRNTSVPRLGVCYYPEHWPKDWWRDDAARMRAMGLSQVRLGEFAWSRIEPEPHRFEWSWLDEAIEVLHSTGLQVVMCTPTATPPKWLVDAMPDMIAIDAHGRPRRFGSRRHYCFSHSGYRRESQRITRALAERYGRHPAVIAWQTDNEYGCHDTTLSWSAAALAGFRAWLSARYGSVDRLNSAWGNVFWSMEYRSFEQIDLPNLAVTEPNPAHVLDFRRYSSDQVKAFNVEQCQILREHSPARDLTHNFMGFVTDFDHHAVGEDIDIASWDSYPLGFLEQFWFSDEEKRRYARQGHPDIAAFHHDLYRGVGRGRWWVMEQQPGPVNWARFNPSPLPGMVRFWTLEAIAHGAEVVSYFRWRQAPFAQEQMHAGLLKPDRTDDVAATEVRTVATELPRLTQSLPAASSRSSAAVALIFDYSAEWITATQPQGEGFSALRVTFEWYVALRRLGLDVDIVSSSTGLDDYALVVVPCLPIVSTRFVNSLQRSRAQVVFGPRCGSKTENFGIPAELPPGPLQALIPLCVVRVESLRGDLVEFGANFEVRHWLEHIDTALVAELSLSDGRGILHRHARYRYLAASLDGSMLRRVLATAALEAGIAVPELPEDLRLRRCGAVYFAFNHGTTMRSLGKLVPANARFLLGSDALGPAGVAAWIVDG